MGISVKTNLSALDAIAAAAADMSGVLDAGAQIVAEAARGACPVARLTRLMWSSGHGKWRRSRF